ncbi:MAG: V-type ATPase subunit [Clostridia bacterium]
MQGRSAAYAVGRVRVLEGTLIGRAQLERLAGCGSIGELARSLGELNWGEAKTRQDIDNLCAAHMREACATVRECSSDEALTDCFLIGYDALNLKALYKMKALGGTVATSELGILNAEKLRRAVDENDYRELPPEFKGAMEEIEKQASVKLDPLFVDSEIDKAMYRYIARRISGTGEKVVRQYFTCKVELINLTIALRAHAMGRGGQFAGALFVEGGTIPLDKVQRVADEPERAWDLIRLRPYADQLAPSVKALDVGAIERATDDYLLGLLRPHRYEPTSVLPLIGYLLARSREAMAVRLLAAAKTTGVKSERIMERLRALY